MGDSKGPEELEKRTNVSEENAEELKKNTEELEKKAEELKKQTEELERQMAELRAWVARSSHIPKDIDDKLLRRFLHSCFYDIEKAKRTIEVFTNMRLTSPELFTDRDPLGARVQKALRTSNMAQINISNNRNLWILQLNDPGLYNFDHLEFARLTFIAGDAWFLENDRLEDEDITIMDAKDMSLKIFWKIKMSVARKLFKFQEEAMPIRLKQMHMVNAPYFIDKLFSIIKQFVSKETIDMVHFHLPNSETLFEFISRDDLPTDYGGNLESLEVHNQRVLDLMTKHSSKMGDPKGPEELEKRTNVSEENTEELKKNTEELEKKAEELKKQTEELERQMAELRAWVARSSHIPKDIGELLYDFL